MIPDLSSGALGEDVVVVVPDGAVRWIVLNRPTRMNAWTPEMDVAFLTAVRGCVADADARVLVVTGAGRGFCAGGDMDALTDLVSGDTTYAGGAEVLLALTGSPKPVIAAVNGGCAGSGFALAMACDLRFASASAKLTAAFPRRGLPAEQGTSWLLPRIVGHANAMDILLSGRKLDAAEALRLGVVSAVHEDDVFLERVADYADDLAANCSPRSMATIKRQVYADATRTFPDALADAERLTHASHRWPDAAEGTQSFVERRPPAFPPLDAGFDAPPADGPAPEDDGPAR